MITGMMHRTNTDCMLLRWLRQHLDSFCTPQHYQQQQREMVPGWYSCSFHQYKRRNQKTIHWCNQNSGLTQSMPSNCCQQVLCMQYYMRYKRYRRLSYYKSRYPQKVLHYQHKQRLDMKWYRFLFSIPTIDPSLWLGFSHSPDKLYILKWVSNHNRLRNCIYCKSRLDWR